MSFRSKIKTLRAITRCFVRRPGLSLRLLNKLPAMVRGYNYSQHWKSNAAECDPPFSSEHETQATSKNPLKTFFDSRERGKGIWKWIHYFDIYHRHFMKFIGREVHVLEIGVYSGGSLEMWRHYFGPKCHVYGVDIKEECKSYENEYTKIFIGDQRDRKFWKTFKERVPAIDIVIDDGGHQIEGQIVTLEEMLPHLRSGGVYLCEDVVGEYSGFSAFVQGIINNLNAARYSDSDPSIVIPTEFQAGIHSVHSYPYVTVIENTNSPLRQLIAPKHGTEWQPFKL